MPELDEMWMDALRQAQEQAAQNERNDVVQYLQLREANDAARLIGISWLFATFLEVATEAKRRGLNLAIEKAALHKFGVGTATMKGEKIRLSLGVHALTVEAGFPRTPQDGFMRGGGLAAARITHFGKPKANTDLLLVRANSNSKDAPIWFTIDDQDFRQQFSTLHLKNHFSVFLGQI
ncbi:MAG: hypothetical protein ABI954_13190 [Pyrinomonadaceae bacterium]